ncbi:MAG: ATP-binding cassette domain-containing protein [Emcibacteraceae bacterium]
MPNCAIRFKNISKKYDDVIALDAVNLEINDNSTTALVGESGSGKTTLLRLVNGLMQPSEGQVEIFGDPIDYTTLPDMRKKMGYAVQGGGLFPHMTVYQNITIMAKLEKWDEARIKERADYLIDLVNLHKDLLDRFPHELSGGQRQRVSLCRALMLNPSLLLLDEPFSALDPITKGYIHDEFVKLQKAESRTILLVTHDMEEAAKLADNIVIIKKGKVVQNGKVEEIIASPKNEYVSNLLDKVTD